MGCGDPRPRKTMVQLEVKRKPRASVLPGTIVEVQHPTAPEPRELPPIDSGDFHCGDCGLTLRYRDRTYHHRCRGQIPIEYQQERQALCDGCMFASNNGVCIEFQSRHPTKPAVISVGVRMARAACPIGLWPKLEADCPSCGRNNFSATGLVSCRYCGRRFA